MSTRVHGLGAEPGTNARPELHGPQLVLGTSVSSGSIMYLYAVSSMTSARMAELSGRFIAVLEAGDGGERPGATAFADVRMSALALACLRANHATNMGLENSLTVADMVLMTAIKFFVIDLTGADVRAVAACAPRLTAALATMRVPQLLREGMPQISDADQKRNALCLLRDAANLADRSSAWVFCARDDSVVCLRDGLQLPPGITTLADIASTVRWLQPLPAANNGDAQASRAQRYVCFYCRAPALHADVRLKECAACHVPAYCSRECQRADWKGFHRNECKALKHGRATAQGLGLRQDRHTWLRQVGAARLKSPAEHAGGGAYANTSEILFGYIAGKEGEYFMPKGGAGIEPRSQFE